MEHFDVIIIGGGPAGLVASKVLVAMGKKTAIIERDKLGGDCTHSGCVPSKTLLKSASAYYGAKNLDKYGLSSNEIHIDTSKVLLHVRNVVAQIYAHETPEVFRKAGVHIIEGVAKFKSPNEVTVGENTYYAPKFIIATGSAPALPHIDGIEHVDYLTNENIFLQESIPSSLTIVGTGAIGIEMATAFNRLGCKVTLISRGKGILKQNDEELSEILLKQLVCEGVEFINSANLIKIEQENNETTLFLEQGDEKITVTSQKILFATGRVPNVDLNLQSAHVAYDTNGIKVNKSLQTSNVNIYAIGDVSTKFKFTHIAEQEAILAASNLLIPIHRKINYDHIGWCVYSDPELAQIGLNEQEAKAKYAKAVTVYRMDYKDTDRGYTDVEKIGAIKVSVLENGTIVGASILGSRAGELIHQLQFAKTFGISFDKLSKMVYLYPTFADLIKQPAKQFYLHKIYSNPFIKMLTSLKNIFSKAKSE